MGPTERTTACVGGVEPGDGARPGGELRVGGELEGAHPVGLQRGVFRSIIELQSAINRFIEEANHDPKPFVWTADPDKIIAAVKRGHQALDPIH